MSKRYFTYDGISSLKYDILIDSIESPTPAEISSRQQIPFTNNTINTAEILGYKSYERRTITIQFQIVCENSEMTEMQLMSIKRWLMNPINTTLYDSANTTHRYQGVCCESVVATDSQDGYADVVATFSANPCMANQNAVSQLKWDAINFETDKFHALNWSVQSGEVITLENNGIEPCGLMLTSDKTVALMVDGVEYTHPANASYCDFLLLPGENQITVRHDGGFATLKFDWNEGVL